MQEIFPLCKTQNMTQQHFEHTEKQNKTTFEANVRLGFR